MSGRVREHRVPDSAFPLAFNTREGRPIMGAGVFRDVEGNWWSVQGRDQHLSFVKIRGRPDWLTEADRSNTQMALELNQLLYKGNIKTFRTQDEADEAFKEAHPTRFLFT